MPTPWNRKIVFCLSRFLFLLSSFGKDERLFLENKKNNNLNEEKTLCF